MAFRVLWSPEAEDSLERLLTTSVDREVVAAAARQIDGDLMAAPSRFGESRYDAMRVGFVAPLGVEFEVMDDARTVIVPDVWRFNR